MEEPQPSAHGTAAAAAAPAATTDEEPAAAAKDSVVLTHKKIAWLKQKFLNVESSDDSDSSAASTAAAARDGARPTTTAAAVGETGAASPMKKRKKATPKNKKATPKKTKKRAVVTSSSSSDSEGRGRQKTRRPAKPSREKQRRRKPGVSASSSSSDNSSSSSSSENDAQEVKRIASARRREITTKERNDRFVHAKQRGDAQPNETLKAKKPRPEQPDAKRIKVQVSKDRASGEVEYKAEKQRPSSASRKRPLPGTTARAEEKPAATRQPIDGDSLSTAKASSAVSPGREKPNADQASPVTKTREQIAQEMDDERIARDLAWNRPKRRSASEDTLDGVKRDDLPADERAKKRKRVEPDASSLADTIAALANMGAAAPEQQKAVKKKFRRVNGESVGAVGEDDDTSKTETPRSTKKIRKASGGAGSPKLAAETPRSLADVDAKPPAPDRQKPASRFRGARDEAAVEDDAKPKKETPRAAKKVRESDEGARSPRAVETAKSSARAKSSASPKRVRKASEDGRDASRAAEDKRKTPREGESSIARVAVKREQRAEAGAKDEQRASKEKRKKAEAEALDRQPSKLKGEQRGAATGKSDGKKAASSTKNELARRPKTDRESTASSDANTRVSKASHERPQVDNEAKSEKNPDTVAEDEAASGKTTSKTFADQQHQLEQKSGKAVTPAPETAASEIDNASGAQGSKPQDASSETNDAAPAQVPASDEKEEGEEGEEEGAKPSQPAARDIASSSVAEKKIGDALPDLLSFVIPKKKIVRTESHGLSRAPASSALPPSGSASLRRTPASSPQPRESDANGSSAGSSQPQHVERAPPRRRRRTKNPVPVAATALSREEISFMRLARKVNSFFEACEKIRATPDSQARSKVGRYDIVDADGKVVADFLPRMKCPTKKQMKTQTELYPSQFFGVSMSLPGEVASAASAAVTPAGSGEEEETVADKADGSDAHKMSEILDTEINSYEQLVFERTEDREVYQRKMYGTTFVPQLLRGRTTLIMRNVRYERKSIGFQFNTDRDREDFAKELGERYAINKSVPRGDIPLKNWQQLLKKMPAVVYLHYTNSEDAELAAQRFVDDSGAPLERRRTNRVGGTIATSTPSSPALQVIPQKSLSTERERSVPESSPVIPKGGDFFYDRKDDVGRADDTGASRDRSRESGGEGFVRDSKPESGNWQPHHDEQRANERRADRNGSDSGRGARDWPPPRSHDRGGASYSGDVRDRDRRPDRFGGSRGNSRFSDARYGPGAAAAPSNGGEQRMDQQRQREGHQRRSRSPPRSRYAPAQREGNGESDPNYCPSGRSDEDERREGERSNQEDSQMSASSNSVEERGRSQDAEVTSLRLCDQQQQQQQSQESQRPSRSSHENGGRSPVVAKPDDRARDDARSEDGAQDGRDQPSESTSQRSHDGGESAARASPDNRTRAGEEGEVKTPEGEERDRAVRRTDDIRQDSERGHGSSSYYGDQRQHRGDGYDSRHRDDAYTRHRYHDGGYDDRGDGRDRHFRGQEFGNRGAYPRRRSRSRSQPRDDRERGVGRRFDGGGHRERDFGHGRDGSGYFDNGGRYDGNNGYDHRYSHHHQQQQPRHHHPDHHDRERSFYRDGDGYRSRPY